MKRVVYVTATNELAGGDTSLFELVSNLDRSEVEPHVVQPHAGPWTDRYRALGVTVHTVPIRKLKRTRDPRWHLRWLIEAPLRVRRISKLLDQLQPDIVHLNTAVDVVGGWAIKRHCRRNAASFVWHVREMELKPRCIERIIFGRIRKWPDRIVAISSPIARRFEAERVVVIPNGVDLSRFRPTDRADAGFLIGWLGRIAPAKGVENVLAVFERVAARLPDARLRIVGDAPSGHESYGEAVRAALAASPFADRIELCGATDRPEDALVGLAAFVHLPDLEEGLGRTVIEAQASGVPVVTWPRGGLVDTVEDHVTGHVVPIGDLDAAADALIALAGAPTRAIVMRRAARDRVVRCFSSERSARNVETCYSELVTS